MRIACLGTTDWNDFEGLGGLALKPHLLHAARFRLAMNLRPRKIIRMSGEQLESSLPKLSHDERRKFIQWFHHHEHEIFDSQEDEMLGSAVETEISRRSDELDANPGLAVPVTDEWFEVLKRRLPDVSPRKASTRRL
jgi:hypothetical protein